MFPSLFDLSVQMETMHHLEDRWLQLYKQRTEMIVARRQEDMKINAWNSRLVKTSLSDSHILRTTLFSAKATALISGTQTSNDFRTPLDQKRQRRATEREARR